MRRGRPVIQRHGDLEACVRSEARRWGWSVQIKDKDHDPLETFKRGARYARPGAGVMELRSPGGASVSVEYGLPEEEDEIRRMVRSVVAGDDSETRRIADPRVADGGY